ncbi:MAG TPA: dienelactone hydrolase family protein [Rhodanobacteraceae bacterium]|nr:dienelactone hydrolase family protein [Rhodanobacteraceae bacterium]
MVVKPVPYEVGKTAFEGQLIYDDAMTTVRPGLVMVPNWYGANAAAVAKAKSIAGRDYVIFLADMYGKNLRPASDEAASAAVKPLYADRKLMRARINAALDQLRAQAKSAPIDLQRLAAIGFCFGGAAVLDLARSGADIAAVVTFHGDLKTDDPALAKNIKASVLAMNGANDRGTMPDAPAFEDEMRGSPSDWQFVVFGGAVHCFTETDAHSPPGCVYDAKVARRAYALMHSWLDEAFADTRH